MTCSGCVASVKKYLSQIDGVSTIEVSLENKEVTLSLNKVIDIDVLQNVLPKKYILSQSKTYNPSLDETIFSKNLDEQSKLKHAINANRKAQGLEDMAAFLL